jgi:hypothetical protein
MQSLCKSSVVALLDQQPFRSSFPVKFSVACKQSGCKNLAIEQQRNQRTAQSAWRARGIPSGIEQSFNITEAWLVERTVSAKPWKPGRVSVDAPKAAALQRNALGWSSGPAPASNQFTNRESVSAEIIRTET